MCCFGLETTITPSCFDKGGLGFIFTVCEYTRGMVGGIVTRKHFPLTHYIKKTHSPKQTRTCVCSFRDWEIMMVIMMVSYCHAIFCVLHFIKSSNKRSRNYNYHWFKNLGKSSSVKVCVCVIIGDLWKWVICCIKSTFFVFFFFLLKCTCDRTRETAPEGAHMWKTAAMKHTGACVPVFCSDSLNYPSKALYSTLSLLFPLWSNMVEFTTEGQLRHTDFQTNSRWWFGIKYLFLLHLSLVSDLHNWYESRKRSWIMYIKASKESFW